MNKREAAAMMKHFLSQLAALAEQGDIGPLLFPGNLFFGEMGPGLKTVNLPSAGSVPVMAYPGYSAPEVYQGRSGQGAWVYFAGAVMHFMCTGSLPPNVQERAAGAQLGAVPPPLGAIVTKALQLNKSQRYKTLAEFKDAVEAAEKTIAQAGDEENLPEGVIQFATPPDIAAKQGYKNPVAPPLQTKTTPEKA